MVFGNVHPIQHANTHNFGQVSPASGADCVVITRAKNGFILTQYQPDESPNILVVENLPYDAEGANAELMAAQGLLFELCEMLCINLSRKRPHISITIRDENENELG